MIYEFINPSDPITFVAPNDQVAFWVTVMGSNGQAGCHREDGTNLDTLLLHAGKTQKQALAIAYRTQRDAQGRKRRRHRPRT